MQDESDIEKGLQVASETRTISELIALFLDTGMSDAEALDTIKRIAAHALKVEKLKKAH